MQLVGIGLFYCPLVIWAQTGPIIILLPRYFAVAILQYSHRVFLKGPKTTPGKRIISLKEKGRKIDS